jgi:hypothetical protein
MDEIFLIESPTRWQCSQGHQAHTIEENCLHNFRTFRNHPVNMQLDEFQTILASCLKFSRPDQSAAAHPVRATTILSEI